MRSTRRHPRAVTMRAAAATMACLALLCGASAAQADTNLGTAGGLTYIQSDPATVTAGLPGTVVADCPSGTKLVGGGVTPQSSPVSESRINSTFPSDVVGNSRPDAWQGDVFNISGAQKSFTAYAICKNSGAVADRFKIGSISGPGAETVTAKCPGGKHVAGGGAYVAGSISTGYVNRSYPIDTDDPNSKPDDGWRARLYSTSASTVSATAFVLCVPQVLRHRSQSSGTFTYCPAGTHVTGGGYSISGDPATAQLVNLFPFADPTNPPDAGFYSNAYDSVGGKTPTGYVVCK